MTMETKRYIISGTLLIMALALLNSRLAAQQIPNFSMYGMNHLLINPAAAGNTERLPVSLSYRKIWAGMNNSPSIQYLSGNMLVAKDMGVGAKLSNFQAGPLRKTGLEASYSYHLSLGTG